MPSSHRVREIGYFYLLICFAIGSLPVSRALAADAQSGAEADVAAMLDSLNQAALRSKLEQCQEQSARLESRAEAKRKELAEIEAEISKDVKSKFNVDRPFFQILAVEPKIEIALAAHENPEDKTLQGRIAAAVVHYRDRSPIEEHRRASLKTEYMAARSQLNLMRNSPPRGSVQEIMAFMNLLFNKDESSEFRKEDSLFFKELQSRMRKADALRKGLEEYSACAEQSKAIAQRIGAAQKSESTDRFKQAVRELMDANSKAASALQD